MSREVLIEQVVNLTFSSNTYILFSELYDNFWLVDCGDIKPVTEWINLHKKLLTGIFITHTHFDHIYGLNKVVSLFPDCIVYTSEKGQKGLYSDKFNISHYNGESFIYQFDNIGILVNNDKIELFPNIFMNVIATPGHDWSCLTYRCNESLFTGDSFLPDYEAFSKFPKSNSMQTEESLIKIKRLIASGARNVYPGHGDIKTIK